MKPDAQGIPLKWTGDMMPHAVLDILRGCNATCEGCYNVTAAVRPKPLAQIRQDLRTLMTRRRLQAISLTGGEPLLHPDLDEVIRDAKAAGLRSVLMTNGVLLDDQRARQLKSAGLDMVLLHVQSRQHRPDLRAGAGRDDLRKLRRDKIACAVAAGLDAGLSAVMYPDAAGEEEIRDLVGEVAASESVHFLMICPEGDFSAFANLQGDVRTGYRQPGECDGIAVAERRVGRQADLLYGILREAGFGLFAWLGSSADANDLRWSTWGSGVLNEGHAIRTFPVRPVWTDRLLMELYRVVSGRHVFHVRPSTARFRFQLALSLLSREGRQTALPLLAGSWRAGTRLHRKHVMVEHPPVRQTDGTVVICRECPDITVNGDRLVPPCLSDRMGPCDTDRHDVHRRSLDDHGRQG